MRLQDRKMALDIAALCAAARNWMMIRWSSDTVPSATAIMSIVRIICLPISIFSKFSDGGFMKWYKKLYLGESIRQQSRMAKYQIAFGKHPEDYYCILLPENPKDLLDILPGRMFSGTRDRWKDQYIIGLAGDKAEAFEVVRQIIEEVYIRTGSLDIPAFLGI